MKQVFNLDIKVCYCNCIVIVLLEIQLLTDWVWLAMANRLAMDRLAMAMARLAMFYNL